MPNTFNDLKQAFPQHAKELQDRYREHGLPALADNDPLSEKIITDAIIPKLPANASADMKKDIEFIAKGIDDLLNNTNSNIATSNETPEQKSKRNLQMSAKSELVSDYTSRYPHSKEIAKIKDELKANTKKFSIIRATFGSGGDERLNFVASKPSSLENTSDPTFFVYNFFVRLAEKAKQVDQAYIEEYNLIMEAEKKIKKEQVEIDKLDPRIALNKARIQQYQDEINALNASHAANANPNGTAASSLPAGSAGNPAPSNSADVDNSGTVSNEDLVHARAEAEQAFEEAKRVAEEAYEESGRAVDEMQNAKARLDAAKADPATDPAAIEALQEEADAAYARAVEKNELHDAALNKQEIARQNWQELAHQSVGLDATKVDVVVTAADANAPIATQSAPSLASSSFLASASVASKKGHPTAAGEVRTVEQDAPNEHVDKGPGLGN